MSMSGPHPCPVPFIRGHGGSWQVGTACVVRRYLAKVAVLGRFSLFSSRPWLCLVCARRCRWAVLLAGNPQPTRDA